MRQRKQHRVQVSYLLNSLKAPEAETIRAPLKGTKQPEQSWPFVYKLLAFVAILVALPFAVQGIFTLVLSIWLTISMATGGL